MLGHIQRGGSPTAYDRVLATRYGAHAARAAHEQTFGSCVALNGEDIVTITLEEAIGDLKVVPVERYENARSLFG